MATARDARSMMILVMPTALPRRSTYLGPIEYHTAEERKSRDHYGTSDLFRRTEWGGIGSELPTLDSIVVDQGNVFIR